MKNKIIVTINLSQLDKSRITERKFTNKEGKEVTVKEYKMELVPLKQEKSIKTGNGWEMIKTYFVTSSSTKEERQAKTQLPILGDGIEFRTVGGTEKAVEYPQNDISPDSIPF
jgi:hypothetical protein